MQAEQLIELEHEGWRALCGAAGAAYYERRLAANALMAFPFGVMPRADAIVAMDAAQPWARFEISDARVVELTDDSAVLVYSVDAQRNGQEPYRAVISSVYAREEGEWRLAFHHQSPSAA